VVLIFTGKQPIQIYPLLGPFHRYWIRSTRVWHGYRAAELKSYMSAIVFLWYSLFDPIHDLIACDLGQNTCRLSNLFDETLSRNPL
jgi:hypothetical protein